MKVGIWISEKKWKKLNITLLQSLLYTRGHELIRLNLDQRIEQQGPFGAILHKISDEIAKATHGDLVARQRIMSFEVSVDR